MGENAGAASERILAGCDGLVVGHDRGLKRFGGNLKVRGELGDGARLEGVAAHERAVEHGPRERAHGGAAVGVENGEGDAAGLREDGFGEARARTVFGDEAFAERLTRIMRSTGETAPM